MSQFKLQILFDLFTDPTLLFEECHKYKSKGWILKTIGDRNYKLITKT